MSNFELELERFFEHTNTHKISDLALVLGVSPTTIRTWRTRQKIPDNIYRKLELPFNELKSSEQVSLPFYNVEASAGAGTLVEDEEKANLISFDKYFLSSNLGVNRANVFMMSVKGDSMEPTIKNSALIMVDRDSLTLTDGIYVLRYFDQLLVKRLNFSLSGVVRIISDNTAYPMEEIHKEQLSATDVEIIGRVVWTGQRM